MGRRLISAFVFLFATIAFANTPVADTGQSFVVELDNLPSAYSVRYAGFRQILEDSPELHPRTYRRLRFKDGSDERSFSLKTGNAPDVLSLGAREYEHLAKAGMIVDLSSHLLREGTFNGDGLVEASWTPLRESAAGVLHTLVKDDRIYAFPGKHRIHGVVIRRDLLESEDYVLGLDLSGVARLAVRMSERMPRGSSQSGIALCVDAETLMYWAIADYGNQVSLLPPTPEPDLSVRRDAAAASLQKVCAVLGGILNGRTRDGVERSVRPAGRLVQSVEEGLGLFRSGQVGMAMCTREDVLTLVDDGVAPQKLLFVPLAGSEVVPDFEILSVYSGALRRDGGEQRVEKLVEFLKLYSSQFLAAPASPLYLWYERSTVSAVLRRGYGDLYTTAEMSVCPGMPAALPSAWQVAGKVRDLGSIVPVYVFCELAGVGGFDEMSYLAQWVRGGADSGQEAIDALKMLRARQAGTAGSLVFLGLLIAMLLYFSFRICRYAGSIRRFRACMNQVPRLLIILILPLLLLVGAQLLVPVCFSVFAVAGLVTGRSVSGSERLVIANEALSVLGSTLFGILATVAVGIILAVVLALLVSRLNGWRVIVAFTLVLPLTLAGFWGALLGDAVFEWLGCIFGPAAAVKDRGMLALLQGWSAIWAALPFACMAYLHRIRRIDTASYEALKLDGGTAYDRLIMVTLPSLEPAMKLHGLILAVILLCGSSSALLGSVALSAGGLFLRSLLFDPDGSAGMLLSALLVCGVLAVVATAVRWFYSIRFAPTYERGKA